MNIKIIIIVATIILVLLIGLFFYYRYRTKVWRRRFPEFPVRIFEMACGNIYTEIENRTTNDKQLIKIDEWFDNDFQGYISEIVFVNNNVYDLSHNIKGSFINSWLKGVIHTLPQGLVNKINNEKPYYKFLMFNEKLIERTCPEMYLLVLEGTQRYIINETEYIANKGDVIYIPKNTYYTIIPFNKSNIILTVN